MNQGPGGEEKVGYHKTSNFPSIGMFTVSPWPQELTNCVQGQAAPLSPPPPQPWPGSPSSPAAGSSLLPIDLPATAKATVSRFLYYLCLLGNLRQLQRCSEMHRTGAQQPALPFTTVSFKDGEQEHEIAKSRDISAFILPSEKDQELRCSSIA